MYAIRSYYAPQSVNTLMIIAHNPTIENVATTLALENQYLMFKTATVVVFTAYISYNFV